MSTPAVKLIMDARIVTETGLFEGHVVLRDRRIQKLTEQAPAALLLQQDNVEIFSAEGALLTPGLIDQHINGCLGCDFNTATIGDIQAALRQLPARGITSIIPTVITAPLTDMMTSINTLEEVIHLNRSPECRVLGLHLEGPVLNTDCRGTHPAQHITGDSQSLLSLLSPNTKLVTLAPENDPDGRITRQLLEQGGIRVQAGHSQATQAQMVTGVQHGISGVAHLYNAMRSFHHREPGIIGEALTNPTLQLEVIADGAHVAPGAIALALAARGPKAMTLVSDAMSLAGLDPDLFQGQTERFAGQAVRLEAGKAINTEGHLAGSAALLDDCLRNMVTWGLLPFETAVSLATQNPARYLGLDNPDLLTPIGKIAPGYCADLVLWDPKTLAVKATWLNGQLVYQQAKALV